jgi:hypothetical protein
VMQHTTPHTERSPRWTTQVGTSLLALSAGLVVLVGVAGTAGAATGQPGGTSGKVAALSAASMEVQNQSTGQTTVNWSTTTTFSKVVTETVSAITVGECVNVTGTPSKKSKTTIAASNITIRPAPTSGSCTAPTGGPAGTFHIAGGAGAGAGFPAGGRTFARGGGPGGPRGFGFARRGGNIDLASGKVTAVGGTTLTVSGFLLNPSARFRNSSSKAKTTGKPVTPPTQKVKVTTSKSTKLSETQSTTASSLAVGDCVTAFGQVASTGAVTAKTVSIDSTSAASCTGPAGFFSGAGGGPGPIGGPSGGQVTNG